MNDAITVGQDADLDIAADQPHALRSVTAPAAALDNPPPRPYCSSGLNHPPARSTPMPSLSHLNTRGEAVMVDVSDKSATQRVAVAEGFVAMSAATLALVTSGTAKKGDVLATARIAGIMAAKKTHDLIPLCHPLMITKATVDLEPQQSPPGIRVRAEVKVGGQTGVEMEALTAVSIACLTLYDMLKAAEKGMVIGPIRLIEKTGGKSGAWHAADPAHG
jgi:cyclic pyranopterin monophosphate synthase